MVDAYVERLLREITGSDAVQRDERGIYPFKHDNVTFAVHVVGDESAPSVRIWSVAVTEVEKSLALLEELNTVNARILYARSYWADDSVVFEDAVPGLSLNRGALETSLNEVAATSGFFGPRLSEQFGGTVPGAAAPSAEGAPDLAAPADPTAEPAPGAGLYL